MEGKFTGCDEIKQPFVLSVYGTRDKVMHEASWESKLAFYEVLFENGLKRIYVTLEFDFDRLGLPELFRDNASRGNSLWRVFLPHFSSNSFACE